MLLMWKCPKTSNQIDEGAIQRFRSGVKNSRVIELHNTCHYVFIVDEALVVRETRNFLFNE